MRARMRPDLPGRFRFALDSFSQTEDDGPDLRLRLRRHIRQQIQSASRKGAQVNQSQFRRHSRRVLLPRYTRIYYTEAVLRRAV